MTIALMADQLDILLAKIKDAALRRDLGAQMDRLRAKRRFGLVFEDHIPERVRLLHHPVRPGVTVVLRADTDDDSAFLVEKVHHGKALVQSPEGVEWISVEDLIVVAAFGHPIYPGLRPVESVVKDGERPSHIVINGENHHVLEALRFTHARRIDCIYIDPPYNSGGTRDWKYDNHYVDENDLYRHSKWLAFMHRRLLLAKELLNPEESVLIIAIDENEVHRVALLLEQTFKGQRIEMVTTVVNPRGKYREGGFSRTEEHLFFVMQGAARVAGEPDEAYGEGSLVPWRTLRRSDVSSKRGTKKGGPNQFYPIYIDNETRKIVGLGDPLLKGVDRHSVVSRKGITAVFPIRDDGTEMNWGLTPDSLRPLIDQGFVRVGKFEPGKPQPYAILYLTSGRIADIASGRARIIGHDDSGAAIVRYIEAKLRMPPSTWTRPSHNAEIGGTNLLKALLGEKSFDYPKSLYAVEDALRYFVGHKPKAIVLDFFGGSGTTAHAVMRLNRQDGGTRQSLVVTNNEVSGNEADLMKAKGIRPGDAEWEERGVFESVTRPRIRAAVTGLRPDGVPIRDHYRFVDEFPMSEGFIEDVQFFELVYLDSLEVELDLSFELIAPLLWLRAGGRGDIITRRSDSRRRPLPFDSTDLYGVLFDTDKWRRFVDDLSTSVKTVFVVTDSSTTFAGISSELPPGIEAVRLYENYLRTFAINQ